MNQYEQGLKSIQEWLAHPLNQKYISAKIELCWENYPHDKPIYTPYYDAMIAMLHEALATCTVAQITFKQGAELPALYTSKMFRVNYTVNGYVEEEV